jgi:hypothetical protein
MSRVSIATAADTKTTLKKVNADLTAFFAVKNKMKVTFQQKIALVPKDFAPVKAKPDASAKHSINEHNVDDDLDGSQRPPSPNTG